MASGALGHRLLGDIFDARGDPPEVAEQVDDRADAVVSLCAMRRSHA
jgi:hypothetical protein